MMNREPTPWRASSKDLFEQVHELAESMFGAMRPWSPLGRESSLLPDFPAWRSDLRVQETAKDVVVYLSVPGADKKDIHIDATEDALTIRGERRLESQSRDGKARQEGYTAFRQTVRFPAAVKPSEAKASIKEGLLRVTLPKQRETRSHRVSIE